MILAGIDEAGLGPRLGPLLTASAVMEVPEDWTPERPWQEFRHLISGKATDRKTHVLVADSKGVYKRKGINELEKTVCIFSLLSGGGAGLNARGLFSRLLEKQVMSDVYQTAWYAGIDQYEPDILTYANSELYDKLSLTLCTSGVRILNLTARVCSEARLNGLYRSGLNKNSALLGETGSHLKRLFSTYADADKDVLVMVDKQCARNDYLPFLYDFFPQEWIYEDVRSDAVSKYRIKRNNGLFTVIFAAKADLNSFPTALASMTAKYFRECFMQCLNRWFCQKKPELRPTAGYPGDAGRWLKEAKQILDDEKISDYSLIRER